MALFDRRYCLLLHGVNAGNFDAELALRVFELASDILLGHDPQAKLAALADIRPLDRVEIAGVGVRGDHRADRQMQRADLPFVADLFVLARR